MPRAASNRVGADLSGSVAASESVQAALPDLDSADGSIDKPPHDPEAVSARAKRQKELLRKKKAERRAHAKHRAEQARQLQEQRVVSTSTVTGGKGEGISDADGQRDQGAKTPSEVGNSTFAVVDAPASSTDGDRFNRRVGQLPPVRPAVDHRADDSESFANTNGDCHTRLSASESPPQHTAERADNQQDNRLPGGGGVAETAAVVSTETHGAYFITPPTEGGDRDLQAAVDHVPSSNPAESLSQVQLPPIVATETMSTMTAIAVSASTIDTTPPELVATVPKSKGKRKKKMSARSSAHEAATTIQQALKKNFIKCKSLVRHSSKVFADDASPQNVEDAACDHAAPNEEQQAPPPSHSNGDRVSMDRLFPKIPSGSISSNKVQPIDCSIASGVIGTPKQSLNVGRREGMTHKPIDVPESSVVSSTEAIDDVQEAAPTSSTNLEQPMRVKTPPPALSARATNVSTPNTPDVQPLTSSFEDTPNQGEILEAEQPQQHNQRRRTRTRTKPGRNRSKPASSGSSNSHSSPSSSFSISSRRSSVSASSSCSCSSSYSPSSSDQDEQNHQRPYRKEKHHSRHPAPVGSRAGMVDLEGMAMRIQAHMRGVFGRQRARMKREELDAQLRAEALSELEHDASVAIQAHARGFLTRRHLAHDGISSNKRKRRRSGEEEANRPPVAAAQQAPENEGIGQNTADNISNLPGYAQDTNKGDDDKKTGVWPEELNLEAQDDWEELGELANTSGECVTHARFLSRGQLRIFCGTWNMHAKKPADDDLRLWIRRNKYHIVAIGTEECVHSIAKSVVFTSKKSWEKQLKEALGDEYTLVASHALTAIHHAVFVHESALPLLSHVQSDAVATGLGNQLGNKGGVGVALCVGGTSFLFVNCHFDAHQRNVDKRNANFQRINQELKLFPPAVSDSKTSSFANARKSMPAAPTAAPINTSNASSNSRRSMTGATPANPRVSISSAANTTAAVSAMRRVPAADRFDRVFWFGDLNYRVNGTRRMVDLLLLHDQHAVLRFNDQLSAEMARGRVFPHFHEGPLHFRPTYKFDKRSTVYDSSPKQRIPSWTDRVLFRSNGKASDIEALSYRSHMSFQSSDHRPVGAVFQVAFSPMTSSDGVALMASPMQSPSPSPPKKSEQQQPLDAAPNEFGRVLARGYRASQSKSEVCVLM